MPMSSKSFELDSDLEEAVADLIKDAPLDPKFEVELNKLYDLVGVEWSSTALMYSPKVNYALRQFITRIAANVTLTKDVDNV